MVNFDYPIARDPVKIHAEMLSQLPPRSAPIRAMKHILDYLLPSEPMTAQAVWVQVALSTLAAWASSFAAWFLGLPVPLLVLALSMVADYVTGFLASHIQRDWNWRTGTDGILRKTAVLTVLIILFMVVRMSGLPLWVASIPTCFFAWNEWKSVIANLRKGKVEVPGEADEILAVVRAKIIALLKVEVAAEKAAVEKADAEKKL